MRVSRLALKIYLYSLVTGLATLLVFVGSFRILIATSSQESALADRAIAELWAAETGSPADVDVWMPPPGPRGPPPLDATIYDLEGKLIASTASPPLPAPSKSQLRQLDIEGELELDDGLTLRPVRSGGRLVAVGIVGIPDMFPPPHPPPGFPPQLTLPLLLLAFVFLVATTVFAGHVAKPLQRLSDTAKRFGRGDFTRRAGLRRRDEIGDLATAFDEMAERVASLMAAQQELLVNVSHELLTPLSRIRVAVDLITDGEATQAQELVPEISHDLLELERLIDDAMTVARLDLSRVSEGADVLPLRRAQCSAAALVAKAVERFGARSPTHRVAIDVSTGMPQLSIDVMLMRRVLENLLDNARKYSDLGTTIRVRAWEGDRHVHLSVSDDGIGIDDEDLQRVFTPFFRSDRSRSRSTGGVGLGLALTRRVVEAHGGITKIDSGPRRGTTVTISLPVP